MASPVAFSKHHEERWSFGSKAVSLGHAPGAIGVFGCREWERTREESHFSSSYDAGDSEQLPYDVPLPMGLIQDHPEPLLIDRRLLSRTAHQACGKHSKDSADNSFDATSRRGDGCDSDESNNAMPMCNAEPMTREEADDFDKLSMGSCFLEFGSFEDRTSRDEPGEASLRTIASQSAAEALQIFQAEGVLSRSSMDAGSRRMQASGSTDGDPGSNRSSVDTVPAAASSMLYKSSSWEEGSKATQGLASQQDLVRQPLAAKAQQVQMRNQQAAVQAAAQGGAPANARAARQALCLGLPDSRPRLNLTQKEVVQTSLQQMQTQQVT
jgi:hypothetical protein